MLPEKNQPQRDNYADNIFDCQEFQIFDNHDLLLLFRIDLIFVKLNQYSL